MRLGSTNTNKGHGTIRIQLGVSMGWVGFGVDPTPYPTGSGEWTIDPLSTKCSGQGQLFGSLIKQVEIVNWFLVWSTTQKNQRTQHTNSKKWRTQRQSEKWNDTQQQSKDPWDWKDEVKSNCTETTNPKIYETKMKSTERQREERLKIKLERERSTCERGETTTLQQ